MNRKIFMFERRPTYQEDPSFYAERVVGQVKNIFTREYNSNVVEQVSGIFTGVNVTVAVLPYQVDRVTYAEDYMMLTDFSIGSGSAVSVPVGPFFVYV